MHTTRCGITNVSGVHHHRCLDQQWREELQYGMQKETWNLIQQNPGVHLDTCTLITAVSNRNDVLIHGWVEAE